MADFFIELSIITLLAFFIAFILSRVNQPLIVGYIISGVIAGPYFFNLLVSTDGYEVFAHIGVAFLLFIVGLHLNIKLIREVGIVSLVTGLGQILFTLLLGLLLTFVLGYSWTASLIISIGLSFSSTIIIVKLLSDKNGLDKLYGKISLGFLLVQDFVAVIALVVIGSFLTRDPQMISTSLLTLFLAPVAIFILAKFALERLLRNLAKSHEIMFVFIIAWCFGVSALFWIAGLPLEIGALLAGVALASSPFQHDISLRIRPLRDFFLIMFFIFLGSQFIPLTPGLSEMAILERVGSIWSVLQPMLLPTVLFSTLVLIGNPLIVFSLMSFMGYSSRTSFLAGLAVSQISEFSIIVVLLAQTAGIVGGLEVSLITFVAILTMTISTYMISYGDQLYEKLAPFLRLFERKQIRDSVKGIQGKKHEILIFGMDRIGHNFIRTLKTQNYLIVDHNPDIITSLKKQHIHCLYGDAGNAEFISEFDLKHVKILISTIPEFEINAMLLHHLRSHNSQATVILTATQVEDALDLYKSGADYVILPHFIGGHYVSTLVEEMDQNPDRFIQERIKHIRELHSRKSFGHEHPTR
ncbi:MAG: cation:proton antiporter [Candidatus Woesearchaeota archaeon]